MRFKITPELLSFMWDSDSTFLKGIVMAYEGADDEVIRSRVEKAFEFEFYIHYELMNKRDPYRYQPLTKKTLNEIKKIARSKKHGHKGNKISP